MQYGYRIVEDLVAGLADYLAERSLASVRDLVGLALPKLTGADSLDRDTVAYPRFDKSLCVGCGRCHVSCADAGHQAIAWNADRSPRLVARSCVGCHLCVLVCPAGAIRAGTRSKKPDHLK